MSPDDRDSADGYLRFHELAKRLRRECPWDVEQTHQSLVPYLIEETYEVVDALAQLDPDNPNTDADLIEELGDLLYQIEFHAAIAEEQGRFTIADVTGGIHDKLVRRHPHIFGDVDASSTAQVLDNWDAIKRAEKAERTSIFDGVAKSLPSLAYAEQVQSKAAKVGFDWENVDGALPKVTEELDELIEATRDGDRDAIAEEVGDLIFAVVNVARHLDVDAESTLRAATNKFRSRFAEVERLAAETGVDMGSASVEVLDGLWEQVKASRR